MAPFLLLAGIPILSIAVGVTQKDNINVFLMGFFRDLGRIKANKRRNNQTSNAMIAVDGGVKYTTWDIVLGRDDPLAGVNFSGDKSSSSPGNDSDGDSRSTTSLPIFTAKELEEFGNGRNGNPIYLSVFGRVYDVTKGENFYGPEASYSMFAGRDVTRALCMASKAPEFLVRSTEGLNEKQINEGKRWLSFFELHDKYHLVGTLESLDSEAWLDALIEDAVAQSDNQDGGEDDGGGEDGDDNDEE